MSRVELLPRLKDYSSWVEYLDTFAEDTDEKDYVSVLTNSVCPEYSGIQSYFHQRIEQTVNAVIDASIRDLRKNVSRYIENNEITGLHLLFNRFSGKVGKCLFFVYIPFLDETFKNALADATKTEMNGFWERLLDSMESDVKKTGNRLMEEELFLIGRIRLFDDRKGWEFTEL